MLMLYQLALNLGRTTEFDVGNQISEADQPYLADLSLEEKRRYRLHRTIERNPRLSKEAKRVHGYSCQVCGFDFEAIYGDLGHDYIEAHHRISLASLPKDKSVTLSPKDDFAVVCANCHRMLHRKGAPKTFEEFVITYKQKNQG